MNHLEKYEFTKQAVFTKESMSLLRKIPELWKNLPMMGKLGIGGLGGLGLLALGKKNKSPIMADYGGENWDRNPLGGLQEILKGDYAPTIMGRMHQLNPLSRIFGLNKYMPGGGGNIQDLIPGGGKGIMLGPNVDAAGMNKWDRAGLPTPGR